MLSCGLAVGRRRPFDPSLRGRRQGAHASNNKPTGSVGWSASSSYCGPVPPGALLYFFLCTRVCVYVIGSAPLCSLPPPRRGATSYPPLTAAAVGACSVPFLLVCGCVCVCSCSFLFLFKWCHLEDTARRSPRRRACQRRGRTARSCGTTARLVGGMPPSIDFGGGGGLRRAARPAHPAAPRHGRRRYPVPDGVRVVSPFVSRARSGGRAGVPPRAAARSAVGPLVR